MTQIAFHFNAPDKLAYACRVARKALRHEQRLVITAPPDILAELDPMLWQWAPEEFIAHCGAEASEELLDASPVLLLPDPRQARHHQVLLNLGTTVPAGFEQFERLIEVVSMGDDTDRQHARARWRDYSSQGYAIVRHDLAPEGRNPR
ncbi:MULTISPECIES: DNA polymerase III subunit chi [Giesbergeria]|uniref:DNA polymerase III subunit chi n=1 Tax=Giesbergeria sinuosa TaxID=80883 RepID=A0ABV9QD94_9BURK